MENLNLKETIRHWYILIITGVLFILLGIWVFRTPAESYLVLSILFASLFTASGILEIIHALANTKTANWGWLLTGGVIDLVVGIMLLSSPSLSLVALPLYVGFILLFRSTMMIGWALELRKAKDNNWGWIMFFGILTMLFSFVLIWNPLFAGMTIVFYTAFALIISGISQIFLAFRLKKLMA